MTFTPVLLCPPQRDEPNEPDRRGAGGCPSWDRLTVASGRSRTRGRGDWTMHPGRAVRSQFIASPHSTCGWMPLVGIPECEDLNVGFQFFPPVFLTTGVGICDPGKQQLMAFSLESLSQSSLGIYQDALSSQMAMSGKRSLPRDSLPGKRQRCAKAWQWDFAQELRLSGYRPSREPTKDRGCLGGRHRPAGGLFSPGSLSHLLSGPHLSGLQKSTTTTPSQAFISSTAGIVCRTSQRC